MHCYTFHCLGLPSQNVTANFTFTNRLRLVHYISKNEPMAWYFAQMAKVGTYNILEYSLVLLCPQTIAKGDKVWVVYYYMFGKRVHLSAPPLYALSKYHIIQFTGSELTC